MSRSLLIPAAVAAFVGTAIWLALRLPEPQSPAALSPAPAAETARAPASGSAIAAGDAAPPARRAPPPGSNVVLAPPPPTLFNEYLGAKQYRILYDRLADSPQGATPEGRLVLYEILRQCATVLEGPRPGFRPNPPKREDFVNGIAPTDPLREKRIAAFDEFTFDRCKGFEGTTIRHAELMKLLNDAAAGGNPHARALAIEQELWQARRAGRPALGDAQIDMLRQIAGTRDPEALRVAGRVLGNSWNDYALRIGPDQQPVEQRAFVNAFLVLSCEYGAPCGPDTPRLLEACAMRGHCDAQSFPDHLYYYGSTPHDATLLTQYRQVLRNAIETGDWSQLSVVRGLPHNRNAITFVPGPR